MRLSVDPARCGLRLAAVVCGLWAGVGAVRAQVPAAPVPLAMPGQVVGRSQPIVRPVGTPLPSAAPQAGTPITGLSNPPPNAIGPGGSGAARPPGTPIDLSNVIAPYPGMTKELTFWERLEERWFKLFESDAPAVRPAYTPGIARRNQDRKKERMERKWWE